MSDFFAEQSRDALEAAIVEISQMAFERLRVEGYEKGYGSRHFIEPLRNFLRDNSDRSAEDLRAMAIALAPGSVHRNCMLFDMAMSRIALPCPRLKASIIALTWGGGRVGFQHMPNPRDVCANEYDAQGDALLDDLSAVRPEDVLVGDDRAFYDALPERFLVYRGGYGVSPQMVSLGLCWTSRRDIAEWFATRDFSGHNTPILLSARVRKRDVFLVFACEHEVVCKPLRWRELRCKRRKHDKRRPIFDWLPALELMFADNRT